MRVPLGMACGYSCFEFTRICDVSQGMREFAVKIWFHWNGIEVGLFKPHSQRRLNQWHYKSFCLLDLSSFVATFDR